MSQFSYLTFSTIPLTWKNHPSKETTKGSMECSSMVSVAAFGQGDLGTNPSWFTVSNSNQKLSFTNNTSVWYSSIYCNPAKMDTLVGVDK